MLNDLWRGVRRQRKAKDSDVPDPRPLQDSELFERTRAKAISREVARLLENFRVPIVLLAKGKSYREIAEMTGVNEGTVKSRVCRGKVLLRRRLRKYL